MEESPTVQFKLNLPAVLKDALAAAAERNGRSLTAEIITRLEASVAISDQGGLDFTLDAFERFIAEAIDNELDEIRTKVRDLEYHTGMRDSLND